MTGFGRGKYENEGRTYTVEIKSVNHKYSDITVKLPRFLNYLEDKIRKRISSSISRGKIDVFINFENYSQKGINIKFNRMLAKEYIKELIKEERDHGFFQIADTSIMKLGGNNWEENYESISNSVVNEVISLDKLSLSRLSNFNFIERSSFCACFNLFSFFNSAIIFFNSSSAPFLFCNSPITRFDSF